MTMTGDWTTQAADAIERAVSVVRDKTVVPAQKATRAVVFGLLAAFFVGTALTVFTIGAFRGLVILSGEAWIAYLVCGGILVVGGWFCWRLRLKQPKDDDDPA
jgi:hypothetical protein